MLVKRVIVYVLEMTYARIDRMWSWPRPFRYLYYINGRTCWMATLSWKLDEKWGTSTWKDTDG